MESYQTKVQGRVALSFDLGYGKGAVSSGFSIAPRMGILALTASPTLPGNDLLIYRGFSTLQLHAGVSVIFPHLHLLKFKPLVPGLDILFGGHYARYIDTPIYFFYPDLSFTPFLGISLLPDGRDRLDLALPLELSLRRDIELDLAIGISFRWNIFLF